MYFRPFGAGTCLASIAAGRILDRFYAHTALAHGFPVDRTRGQDLTSFPIEKARLTPCFPLAIPGILAVLCYGWSLQYSTSRASMAGPLVLQFIVGFSAAAVSTCLSSLLVDLYPEATATVTASSNLARCLVGAGATAAINPMVEAMGVGWAFTLMAAVCVGSFGLLGVELWKGRGWREERRVRLLIKKEQKESMRAER